VTAEARYEVGRFSEREFGINGWEFDACQEVFSYIGYHFWGDPYDQHYVNEKNKGIEFNYIGGFGDRNPSTGWFFKAPDFWSRVAHYCGEFAFDANDQLLQWQGLPDAEMIRYAYHGIPIPNIGHSLGASRLVTAASLGLVHGGVAIAMPILEMANGGVQPIIGNGDIVPGFDLGLIGNPEATTVNVRFILGHSLDDYVTQMRIGGQL
jgi:hypothetical protein